MKIRIEARDELKDGDLLTKSDLEEIIKTKDDKRLVLLGYRFSKKKDLSFFTSLSVDFINFIGCLFEGQLSAYQMSVDSNLQFRECIFCGYVGFSRVKISGDLIFNDCLIMSTLNIYYCSLGGSCAISNTFVQIVHLRHNSISSYIGISRTPYSAITKTADDSKLLINEANQYDFIARDIRDEPIGPAKILLSYPDVYQLKLEDKQIKPHLYHCREVLIQNNVGGEILVTECQFEQINLRNSNKSQLVIADNALSYFGISELTNSNLVKISNIRTYNNSKIAKTCKCTLHVTNSIVGPITMVNCSEKFDSVMIWNSSLQELKLVNSIILPHELKNDAVWKTSEDVYRQLSFAYGNSQNKQYQIIYKALADNLLLKKLSREGFTKHLSDYFILWTNKYSNEHGTNWWKPIILLLIFNLLFFTMIEATVLNEPFAYYRPYLAFHSILFLFKNLLQSMIDHSTVYLDLMNPAHNLVRSYRPYPDIIVDSNFAAQLFSLVSRIFTSYFIFQTLRAFRKLI